MERSSNPQRNHRLRQERIARNWRQRDLAEQLGTTEVTVRRWERGSQQPSSYFQVKLCVLFGKSAEELGLLEADPSAPMTQESASPAEPLALWTVPYPRNPHFTGRDELLERLAQHLSFEQAPDAAALRRAALSQPQAVKGLGGIGKTQVAVEYAYRSRERGDHAHILWINAASEEAIITSFQSLAAVLPDVADKDEKDQRELITAILCWLQRCQQPWLLIFDNADDLSLIPPYIPQQGQGSILVTTRATAVGWLANSVEVEQMGLIEGTQFLLHRAQRLQASGEECNEATNVVIALDGFPLALDQAGAYIEETGCSFADYLQLYEQHRISLLARRGAQASQYPHSVATTWSLSFEKVEQANPAAAELLRLCAFLAPDQIPEELLREGAAYWSPMLQETVSDLFAFHQMLSELLKFSLIKRLMEGHLLSLHRLVQAVQMDQMNFQEQLAWAERVVCAVNAIFPPDPEEQADTWPQCLRYLEQVQACDQLIQQYHLCLPEAAELLDRAGVYLREHASHSLAEPLFQRALAIAEQRLGPQHLQVASCLNNLGILYKERGRCSEAEPLYLRALHIREQALGPHHSWLASSLNNLGILYMEQGRYSEAEPLYLRALNIREQALDPSHPWLASSLNNLGMLYYEQGRYSEAEPLYLRALNVWEQALGPHHPDLAYALNNLGILYYEQGRYSEAEPLYLRALCIREEALGSQHPQVAYPLTYLANLYGKQGKYEQAEPLYQRALCIREGTIGSQHPEVAYTLNGLATLYREQNRYIEAELLYQRALSIREQHLGLQHPETAQTLHDLALLHEMQSHLDQAIALAHRALAIRSQSLGVAHPKTIASRTLYTQLV